MQSIWCNYKEVRTEKEQLLIIFTDGEGKHLQRAIRFVFILQKQGYESTCVCLVHIFQLL